MRSVKVIGLSIVAVLALSAVMAASAFGATKNPMFQVEGTPIAAGEEVGITASAGGNQVLKATGLTIECTNLSASATSVLLSGGLNKEALIYGGCFVPGKACEVSSFSINGTQSAIGKIETWGLNSKLEWLTKAGAEAEDLKQTGTLFEPAEENVKKEKLFAELEVTSCGLANGKHKASGEVLVENEPGGTNANQASHSLVAPATALKTYWRNETGTATEHAVSLFKVTPFGTATYSGTNNVKLGSGLNWNLGAA